MVRLPSALRALALEYYARNLTIFAPKQAQNLIPLPGSGKVDKLPIIAVTMGDVCGIGPEVVARSIQSLRIRKVCQPVIVGAAAFLDQVSRTWPDVRAPSCVRLSGMPETRQQLEEAIRDAGDGVICLEKDSPVPEEAVLGRVSAGAGNAAYHWLVNACRMAQVGIVDAIATAPLNKESLHAAGHNYPGHTEILAAECGVTDFGMMLHLPESGLRPLRHAILKTRQKDTKGHGLSIVHVTLHTSVASIPGLLSTQMISEKIHLLDEFLSRVGCERRAIGVAALNPHGGEHGLFGDEESRLIEPAVEECAAGVCVQGPLPVDTLIRRAVSGEFDGLVAMYHDQGHIPVKLLGFDAAINITLGLPIIRSSPTHGTAFDRAWNTATPSDSSGMEEAILMATRLTQRVY